MSNIRIGIDGYCRHGDVQGDHGSALDLEATEAAITAAFNEINETLEGAGYDIVPIDPAAHITSFRYLSWVNRQGALGTVADDTGASSIFVDELVKLKSGETCLIGVPCRGHVAQSWNDGAQPSSMKKPTRKRTKGKSE